MTVMGMLGVEGRTVDIHDSLDAVDSAAEGCVIRWKTKDQVACHFVQTVSWAGD